jgi:hypothetical protein
MSDRRGYAPSAAAATCSAATWTATTRSPALATLTSAHVRSSLLAASRLIPTTTVLPLPGAGDAGVAASSHGSPRRRAPSGTSSLMAPPPATDRWVGRCRWIDACSLAWPPLRPETLALFALLASRHTEERGGEVAREVGDPACVFAASCSVCCETLLFNNNVSFSLVLPLLNLPHQSFYLFIYIYTHVNIFFTLIRVSVEGYGHMQRCLQPMISHSSTPTCHILMSHPTDEQ